MSPRPEIFVEVSRIVEYEIKARAKVSCVGIQSNGHLIIPSLTQIVVLSTI